MEKTIGEIIENITTVAQRDYFIDSLDILMNSLYSSHQTIYALTALSISLPYSEIIQRGYREQGILENDKDGSKQMLMKIKIAVTQIETLEIRVAYNIPEADVRDIRNWLFFQLKRTIFLNIIVDHTLIGGIVLYRNGKYKDYSISSYIDHYGRI